MTERQGPILPAYRMEMHNEGSRYRIYDFKTDYLVAICLQRKEAKLVFDALTFYKRHSSRIESQGSEE